MKRHVFINPFTDWGFKRIFGQELNKDMLIDFLNDLLEGERRIDDIEYINTEMPPIEEKERGVRFDIQCHASTGDIFIIEMQLAKQKTFVDRAIYYTSRAVVSQGEKGKMFRYKLVPVYGVFFMNFTLDDLPQKVKADCFFTESETKQKISDKIRLVFLQLPLFNKNMDECETGFEKWIFVLKNMYILNKLPFKAQKQIFQKLEDLCRLSKLDDVERKAYDISLKNYIDQQVVKETAHEDGYNEGFQKGESIGLEKGLQKGRAEGENARNIAIARNMLAKGMDVKTIMELTGLSEKEVNKLMMET